MAFSGMVLTTAGKILQAKVQAGITLTFTKIKVGDGVLQGGSTLEALTDLITPEMTIPIQNVTAMGDGTCRVRGVLTNAGLTAGFFVREIGVFANDPDAGEILYSVANAGTECDYLPAGGGAVAIEQVLDIIIAVGSAFSITAVINQSAVLATVKDIVTIQTEIAESTGDGIITGYNVTASVIPDMYVNVAAGIVHMPNGQRYSQSTALKLLISTADATNPRIDLIYLNASGGLSCLKGTPTASPVVPTLPNGGEALASVSVAVGAISITNINITDLRKNKFNMSSQMASRFWQKNTAYNVGNIIYSYIISQSNIKFECVIAGTSGTTQPIWSSINTTIADGTAVWIVTPVSFSDFNSKLQVADIITKGPWVDVRAFGAKGDGSDDSSKIQSVIDYVSLNGGGIVVLPPNMTLMANGLILKSGVNIRGCGYSSVIKNNLINSKLFVNRTAYSDISLENFRITGFGSENSSNGDNDICIDIWNATRLRIFNMFVEDGRGHGIYIRECDTVHISDIFCKNFHEQGVAVTSGNNIIIENIIGDYSGAAVNSQALVDIEPNNGDTITNLIIRNVIMKTPGLVALNLYATPGSLINKVNVSNIYTDNLVISGVSNGNISNLFINGITGIESLSIYDCTDILMNNIRLIAQNIVTTKLHVANCERLNINGISIEGSGENTAIAVDLLGANHCKFNNVHIENAGNFGVRLRNSDGCEFNGLEIEGAVMYGVLMLPTTSNSNTRITGLHVYNCTGTGIYLEGTNNNVYIEGDVSNCTTPFNMHAGDATYVSIGNLVGVKRIMKGTAAPTTGTYIRGDQVVNTAPAASGYMGWVCVAAGTPGTWKGYGLIQA